MCTMGGEMLENTLGQKDLKDIQHFFFWSQLLCTTIFLGASIVVCYVLYETFQKKKMGDK